MGLNDALALKLGLTHDYILSLIRATRPIQEPAAKLQPIQLQKQRPANRENHTTSHPFNTPNPTHGDRSCGPAPSHFIFTPSHGRIGTSHAVSPSSASFPKACSTCSSKSAAA